MLKKVTQTSPVNQPEVVIIKDGTGLVKKIPIREYEQNKILQNSLKNHKKVIKNNIIYFQNSQKALPGGGSGIGKIAEEPDYEQGQKSLQEARDFREQDSKLESNSKVAPLSSLQEIYDKTANKYEYAEKCLSDVYDKTKNQEVCKQLAKIQYEHAEFLEKHKEYYEANELFEKSHKNGYNSSNALKRIKKSLLEQKSEIFMPIEESSIKSFKNQYFFRISDICKNIESIESDEIVKITMIHLKWFMQNQEVLCHPKVVHELHAQYDKCFGMLFEAFEKGMEMTQFTVSYYISEIMAKICQTLVIHLLSDKSKMRIDRKVWEAYDNRLKAIEKRIMDKEKKDQNSQIPSGNIEYQIFLIRMGVQLIPNSDAEIMKDIGTLLVGAAKAIVTKSVNDDLVSGLIAVGKAALKKGRQMINGPIYKAIFQIEIYKRLVFKHMDDPSANEQEIKQLLGLITDVLLNENHKDWAVLYCWVQCMGEIITYKPFITIQKLKEGLGIKLESEARLLWKELMKYEWILEFAKEKNTLSAIKREGRINSKFVGKLSSSRAESVKEFLLKQIGFGSIVRQFMIEGGVHKEKYFKGLLLYQDFNDQDISEDDRWRIRDGFICACLRLSSELSDKDIELKSIVEGVLTHRNVKETHPRVKQTLKNQETLKEMLNILQRNWKSQEAQIKQYIAQKLEELKELQDKIREEEDESKRQELLEEYKLQENDLNEQIENVSGVGNQLGITIEFMKSMKKDLVRIEGKIDEIKDAIGDMQVDLKSLRGKTIKQLIDMRRKKINHQKKMIELRSVYVDLLTRERRVRENLDENVDTKLLTYDETISDRSKIGEINEFLWMNNGQDLKDAMLIHGNAGSGKSTTARKVEEYLWDIYQDNIDKGLWVWSETPGGSVPKEAYEKSPLVPLMVSLPSLRNPLDDAIQETLRSDAYRFDNRQIEELKTAVQEGQLRLVIVLDSYDELKGSFISQNIYKTNKLQKWGKDGSNSEGYPKVITTTRTEILQEGYQLWFVSQQDDKLKALEKYKEVKIIPFSSAQKEEYLKQYAKISIKRVLLDMYQVISGLDDIKVIDDYSKFWEQLMGRNDMQGIDINEEKLLNWKEIQQIIKELKKDPKIMALSREQERTLKVLLSELWTVQKFKQTIEKIDLDSILETPFMMEIVVQVLPEMLEKEKNAMKLKRKLQKELGISKGALIWEQLEEDKRFMDIFSMVMPQQELFTEIKRILDKPDVETQNITDTLQQHFLTRYDFYETFMHFYYESQINKMIDQGQEGINYDTIEEDLKVFARNLALDMTNRELTQVNYDSGGQFYEKQESWEDQYFKTGKDDKSIIRKFLRQGIPLKQKGGSYAFNHKSIQEFLVAKDFFDQLKQQSKQNQHLVNLILDMYYKNKNQVQRSRSKKYTTGNNEELDENDLDFQVKLIYRTIVLKDKEVNVKTDIWDKVMKNAKQIIDSLLQEQQNVRDKESLKEQYAQELENLIYFIKDIQRHTMNRFSYLTPFKKGVLAFLEEKIQLEREIQNLLMTIILFTKIDPKLAQASSNAISILNILKYSFSGKDMEGVVIQNAYLRNADFYGSNLNKANLSNCDLTKANLNECQLQKSILSGIKLGGYITLVNGFSINKIEYSPNGKYILTICQKDGTEYISLFESETGKKISIENNNDAHDNYPIEEPPRFIQFFANDYVLISNNKMVIVLHLEDGNIQQKWEIQDKKDRFEYIYESHPGNLMIVRGDKEVWDLDTSTLSLSKQGKTLASQPQIYNFNKRYGLIYQDKNSTLMMVAQEKYKYKYQGNLKFSGSQGNFDFVTYQKNILQYLQLTTDINQDISLENKFLWGQYTVKAIAHDLQSLVSLNASGQVHLWTNLDMEQPESQVILENESKISVFYSQDSSFLAVVNTKGVGRVFITREKDTKGSPLQEVDNNNQPTEIKYLQFSKDNKIIATLNQNGQISVWTDEYTNRKFILENKDNKFTKFIMYENVVIGFSHKQVDKFLIQYQDGGNTMDKDNISFKNEYKLECSQGGRVFAITQSENILTENTDNSFQNSVLIMSPNMQSFVDYKQGKAYLMESSSQKPLGEEAKKGTESTKVAYSQNGQFLMTGDNTNKHIALWKTSDGKMTKIFGMGLKPFQMAKFVSSNHIVMLNHLSMNDDSTKPQISIIKIGENLEQTKVIDNTKMTHKFTGDNLTKNSKSFVEKYVKSIVDVHYYAQEDQVILELEGKKLQILPKIQQKILTLDATVVIKEGEKQLIDASEFQEWKISPNGSQIVMVRKDLIRIYQTETYEEKYYEKAVNFENQKEFKIEFSSKNNNIYITDENQMHTFSIEAGDSNEGKKKKGGGKDAAAQQEKVVVEAKEPIHNQYTVKKEGEIQYMVYNKNSPKDSEQWLILFSNTSSILLDMTNSISQKEPNILQEFHSEWLPTSYLSSSHQNSETMGCIMTEKDKFAFYDSNININNQKRCLYSYKKVVPGYIINKLQSIDAIKQQQQLYPFQSNNTMIVYNKKGFEAQSIELGKRNQISAECVLDLKVRTETMRIFNNMIGSSSLESKDYTFKPEEECMITISPNEESAVIQSNMNRLMVYNTLTDNIQESKSEKKVTSKAKYSENGSKFALVDLDYQTFQIYNNINNINDYDTHRTGWVQKKETEKNQEKPKDNIIFAVSSKQDRIVIRHPELQQHDLYEFTKNENKLYTMTKIPEVQMEENWKNELFFNKDGSELIILKTSTIDLCLIESATAGQTNSKIRNITDNINMNESKDQNKVKGKTEESNIKYLHTIQLQKEYNQEKNVGYRFEGGYKAFCLLKDDSIESIWDIASKGKVNDFLEPHKFDIKQVVFSPQGDQIITISTEGITKVWNTKDGTNRTLPVTQIKEAKFASTNLRFALLNKNKSPFLFDCENLKQLEGNFRQQKDIDFLEFSKDGTKIITIQKEITLKIWNAKDGNQVGEDMDHPFEVQKAVYSPDGKKVAVPMRDQILLWNTEAGSNFGQQKQVKKEENQLEKFEIQVDSKGQNFLTTEYFKDNESEQQGQIVRLWDNRSGKQIGNQFKTYMDSGNSQFSPSFQQNSQFYLVPEGNKINIYDNKNGKLTKDKIELQEDHSLYSYKIAFNKNKEPVYYATIQKETARNLLIIYNADQKKECDRVQSQKGEYSCLEFLQIQGKNHHFLAVGETYGDVMIRNIDTKETVVQRQIHKDEIVQLSFDIDKQQLAVASQGQIIIVEVDGLRKTKTLCHGHQADVIGCGFIPSKQGHLVSVDENGQVIVWNVEKQQALQFISTDAESGKHVQVLEGNRVLIADEKQFFVYDLGTSKLVSQQLLPIREDIEQILISSDGKYSVSTLDCSEYLIVWDNESNKVIQILHEHSEYIKQVYFSQDGSLLFSVSDQDKMIVVQKQDPQTKRFMKLFDFILENTVEKVQFLDKTQQIYVQSTEHIFIYSLEGICQAKCSCYSQRTFSESLNILAAADDKQIKIKDLDTLQHTSSISKKVEIDHEPVQLTISSSTKTLYYLLNNQQNWIHTLDLTKGVKDKIKFQHDIDRFWIQERQNRDVLYGLCEDEKVVCYHDFSNEKTKNEFVKLKEGDSISEIKFLDELMKILVQYENQSKLYLYDLNKVGQEIEFGLRGEDLEIGCFQVSEDQGSCVVYYKDQPYFIVYDLKDVQQNQGKEKKRLLFNNRAEYEKVCLSKDGQYMALSYDNSRYPIMIYEKESQNLIAQLHLPKEIEGDQDVKQMEFLNNNNLIVLYSDSGFSVVVIWDIESQSIKRKIEIKEEDADELENGQKLERFFLIKEDSLLVVENDSHNIYLFSIEEGQFLHKQQYIEAENSIKKIQELGNNYMQVQFGDPEEDEEENENDDDEKFLYIDLNEWKKVENMFKVIKPKEKKNSDSNSNNSGDDEEDSDDIDEIKETKFSKDKKIAGVMYESGQVKVWSSAENKEICQLQGYPIEKPDETVKSKDKQRIATYHSQDQVYIICIWNVHPWKLLVKFQHQIAENIEDIDKDDDLKVKSIKFIDRKGTKLLTLSEEKVIRVFNIQETPQQQYSAELVSVFKGGDFSYEEMKVSERYIAVQENDDFYSISLSDGKVVEFERQEKRKLFKDEEKEEIEREISFYDKFKISPSEDTVCVKCSIPGQNDYILRIYDLGSGRFLRELVNEPIKDIKSFKKLKGSMQCMALTSESLTLYDGENCVALKTLLEFPENEQDFEKLKVSQCGKFCVFWVKGGKMWIYSIEKELVLAEISEQNVHYVKFSQDSSKVYFLKEDEEEKGKISYFDLNKEEFGEGIELKLLPSEKKEDDEEQEDESINWDGSQKIKMIPEKKLLFVGKEQVDLFDLETGKQIKKNIRKEKKDEEEEEEQQDVQGFKLSENQEKILVFHENNLLIIDLTSQEYKVSSLDEKGKKYIEDIEDSKNVQISSIGDQIILQNKTKIVVLNSSLQVIRKIRINENDKIEYVKLLQKKNEVLIKDDEKRIKKYDTITGQLLVNFTIPETVDIEFMVTLSEKLALLYMEEGYFLLIDLETGIILKKTILEQRATKKFKYSKDGRYICSIDDNSSVKSLIWEAASGKKIASLATEVKDNVECESIKFSPDSEQIMVQKDNKNISFYETKSGKYLTDLHLDQHQEYVYLGNVSPDEKTFATCCKDGIVRLWDMETGGTISCFVGHVDYCRWVYYSPDGKNLVSWAEDSDKTIRIWDIQNKKLKFGPIRTPGEMKKALFTFDSSYLISNYSDEFFFYSLQNGVQIGEQLFVKESNEKYLFKVAKSSLSAVAVLSKYDMDDNGEQESDSDKEENEKEEQNSENEEEIEKKKLQKHFVLVQKIDDIQKIKKEKQQKPKKKSSGEEGEGEGEDEEEEEEEEEESFEEEDEDDYSYVVLRKLSGNSYKDYRIRLIGDVIRLKYVCNSQFILTITEKGSISIIDVRNLDNISFIYCFQYQEKILSLLFNEGLQTDTLKEITLIFEQKIAFFDVQTKKIKESNIIKEAKSKEQQEESFKLSKYRYSKDGNRLIVVIEEENHLLLFDTKTWKLVTEVKNLEDTFQKIMLCPQNKTFTIYCYNSDYLLIFDMQTGRQIYERIKSSHGIDYKKYSSLGNFLTYYNSDNQLYIYNLKKGVERFVFKDTDYLEQKQPKYSPDGKHIISFQDDTYTLFVWDANNMQIIRKIQIPTREDSESIRFLSNNSVLYDISDEPYGFLIDIKGKEPTKVITQITQSDPDSGLKLSNSGRYLIKQLDNKVLEVFCGQTGQFLYHILPPKEKSDLFYIEIKQYFFSYNDDFLIIKYDNDFIMQYSLQDGKSIGYLPQGNKEDIKWIDYNPQLDQFASANQQRHIDIWEAKSGKNIQTFYGHGDDVMYLKFFPDGQRLLSGDDDYVIIVWDTQNGEQLMRYRQSNSNRLTKAKFDMNLGCFLTIFDEDYFAIWDIQNLQMRGSIQKYDHSRFLNFDQRNGQVNFSIDNTGLISFDIQTGKKILNKEIQGQGKLKDLYSSKDGRVFAAKNDDDNDQIFIYVQQENQGYKEIKQENEKGFLTVRVSPDSSIVAQFLDNKSVAFYDVEKQKQTGSINRDFDNSIKGAKLSKTGKYLAIKDDESVQIWVVAKQKRLLCDPIKFERDIVQMRFSKNDQYFVVGDGYSFQIIETQSGNIISKSYEKKEDDEEEEEGQAGEEEEQGEEEEERERKKKEKPFGIDLDEFIDYEIKEDGELVAFQYDDLNIYIWNVKESRFFEFKIPIADEDRSLSEEHIIFKFIQKGEFKGLLVSNEQELILFEIVDQKTLNRFKIKFDFNGEIQYLKIVQGDKVLVSIKNNGIYQTSVENLISQKSKTEFTQISTNENNLLRIISCQKDPQKLIFRYEKECHLFNNKTNQEINLLEGQQVEEVKDIVFSQDSQKVLILYSYEENYSLSIYNIENRSFDSNDKLTQLEDVDKKVIFARDGRYLLIEREEKIEIMDCVLKKMAVHPISKIKSESIDFFLSSPDGKQLYSIYSTGTQVLDVQQGKDLGELLFGLEYSIDQELIKFSKDSKYMIAGSDNEQFYIWECKTGTLLHKIEMKHTTKLIKVLPDQTTVVLGDNYGNLVYIDMQSGKTLYTQKKKGCDNYIEHIKFDSQGNICMTLDENKQLEILEFKKNKTIASYIKNGSIEKILCNPKQNTVAVTYDNSIMSIFALDEQRKQKYSKQLHSDEIKLKFIHNGQKLVEFGFSYQNCSFNILDLKEQKELYTFSLFDSIVGYIMDPVEEMIVMKFEYGFKILDINNFQKESQYIMLNRDDIDIDDSQLKISNDGSSVYTQLEKGVLTKWNVDNGIANISPPQPEQNEFFKIAFSPDNRYIAMVRELVVFIHDIVSGHLVNPLCQIESQHSKTILDIKYSPNGKYLASCCEYGEVVLWDGTSGRCLHKFPKQEDYVRGICFSSDSKYLVSGCDTKYITIYDMETRQIVKEYRDPEENYIYSVEFNSQGNIIAIIYQNCIVLYDWIKGKRIVQFSDDSQINTVKFNPDQQYSHMMLYSTNDHCIKIIDTRNSNLIQKLEQQDYSGDVQKLFFQNSLLASIDDEHAIKVYQIGKKEDENSQQQLQEEEFKNIQQIDSSSDFSYKDIIFKNSYLSTLQEKKDIDKDNRIENDTYMGRIWDAQNGKMLKYQMGIVCHDISVDLIARKVMIAQGSLGKQVSIRTFQQDGTEDSPELLGFDNGVANFRFREDDCNFAVVATFDQKISLVKKTSLEELMRRNLSREMLSVFHKRTQGNLEGVKELFKDVQEINLIIETYYSKNSWIVQKQISLDTKENSSLNSYFANLLGASLTHEAKAFFKQKGAIVDKDE